MFEIKDCEVFNLERAVVSSGFSMDTGEMFDNFKQHISNLKLFLYWMDKEDELLPQYKGKFELGKKRYERACWLGNKNNTSGECNLLTGILVSFNMKYPLYISKEIQRYHFFQIVTSSSTMHRLTAMNLDDLDCDVVIKDRFIHLVDVYNRMEAGEHKKAVWLNIVKSCPSGLELFMHCTTNYLQIKTMYNQRENHKLPEWSYFRNWAETELPYFKELCLGGKE